MPGTKTEVRPGTWRLRVVTGYDSKTGNPRQALGQTFKGTKKQADTALAAFVTEVTNGTASLDASATVNTFLDQWLAHIDGQRSPTTIRGYKEKMNRVRRDFGTTKMGKFSTQPQQIDRAYRRWMDARDVRCHRSRDPSCSLCSVPSGREVERHPEQSDRQGDAT